MNWPQWASLKTIDGKKKTIDESVWTMACEDALDFQTAGTSSGSLRGESKCAWRGHYSVLWLILLFQCSLCFLLLGEWGTSSISIKLWARRVSQAHWSCPIEMWLQSAVQWKTNHHRKGQKGNQNLPLEWGHGCRRAFPGGLSPRMNISIQSGDPAFGFPCIRSMIDFCMRCYYHC